MRKNKLSNKFLYDFVSLLYVYNEFISVNIVKEKRFQQMKEFLDGRVVKNKEYFAWCMEHSSKIKARDHETLLYMIKESCKIKRDVVEKDPTEKGDRALLNFGHTLGHAVEKLKNFEMLHGQCVAVGCVAAMKLSEMRGNLLDEDVLYAEQCFENFGLPVRIDELEVEEILKISKSDKKMEAGKIKFVLLHEIGNAYVDKTVSDEELKKVSAYLLSKRA